MRPGPDLQALQRLSHEIYASDGLIQAGIIAQGLLQYLAVVFPTGSISIGPLPSVPGST